MLGVTFTKGTVYEDFWADEEDDEGMATSQVRVEDSAGRLV